MIRAAASFCLIALLAASAWGDRLILVDGRRFTGEVTVEEDSVLIVMAMGSMRFPKDQVAKILLKDTPRVELNKRLETVDRSDARQLFEVAEWAADNDLSAEADKLHREVLALQPEHAGAHRALGQVKIDGHWRELPRAMELARSKLAAGQYRALLDFVLPDLELAARHRDRKEIPRIRLLAAEAKLRSGDFAEAATAFSELGKNARSPRQLRYAAIAEILVAHPDGMYVLTEPYPPAASLLGAGTPSLPRGPASLRDPLAMRAALLARAKAHIQAGRKEMRAAAALETRDPDAARAKYAAAERTFDKADALVPLISRSYRVEIARRRIRSLRDRCTAGARKFDKEMKALGRRTLSAAAFRTKVLRLIYLLDKVRADLKEVTKIAEPYSRELVLEVEWAQSDLKTMDRMRSVLTKELDGAEK